SRVKQKNDGRMALVEQRPVGSPNVSETCLFHAGRGTVAAKTAIAVFTATNSNGHNLQGVLDLLRRIVEARVFAILHAAASELGHSLCLSHRFNDSRDQGHDRLILCD